MVVIADGTDPLDYAAIDVIVQAEHGPDGLAWLITWDPDVADSVADTAVPVGRTTMADSECFLTRKKQL